MSIRVLSEELQKRALIDLNEVPDRIPKDLEHIRQWLAKQPHLKVRSDDQWLLAFLRGCKFSLERTKEKLDMFYTTRTLVPEFFGNRDPFLPDIQEVLALGAMLPLPLVAGPAAPRVILFRDGMGDSGRIISVENGFKVALMTMDILLLEDDNFVVAGQQQVVDCRGTTLRSLISLNPTMAKKTTACIQHVYPIRPKGFHCIEAPSFFETMFGMVKSFITEKLKSRVNVYSGANTHDLYKIIPQSIFPTEYGGDGGSLDLITTEWKKKVESYRDWFLEDAQYCSDEAKRPGKPKTASELFGVEGSFRNLNFD